MRAVELIVECPHCNCNIVIEKLNCHIFRHGVMKDTGKQIDPHATKKICDELFEKKLIFGCGKPFKIVKKDDEDSYTTEICEYI